MYARFATLLKLSKTNWPVIKFQYYYSVQLFIIISAKYIFVSNTIDFPSRYLYKVIKKEHGSIQNRTAYLQAEPQNLFEIQNPIEK